MYLKSVVCVISSAFSLSIYAQTEKQDLKNIDLFASFGALFANDIGPTNASSDFGLELGLSGLYSFPSFYLVKPVLGGGLHSSAFTIKLPQNIEWNVSWASLEANAGVKFNPIAKLNLFTLVNLGYAPATKVGVTNSKLEVSSTAKNHSYYGATLIGTVPLTDAMSIGGSFTFNKHKVSEDKSIGNEVSFNQYTTSLVLQYSI